MLLWLVGFFGIIFATNAYFITAAVKTFRGEDEQKPYLQGVEYNHTLARRAEQAKLGWKATIGAHRLPSGEVRVDRHAAHSRDGAPETGAALTGELRHPADENRDRALHFTEIGARPLSGRTGRRRAPAPGM